MLEITFLTRSLKRQTASDKELEEEGEREFKDLKRQANLLSRGALAAQASA